MMQAHNSQQALDKGRGWTTCNQRIAGQPLLSNVERLEEGSSNASCRSGWSTTISDILQPKLSSKGVEARPVAVPLGHRQDR